MSPFAGSRDPAGHPALALARESAGRAQATIYGALLRTTAADAAFVNGMFAHVLDYDDGLEGMHGHPSVTALPAALAVGEQVGASGRETCSSPTPWAWRSRASWAAPWVYGHYRAGWHKTSTIGIFAGHGGGGMVAAPGRIANGPGLRPRRVAAIGSDGEFRQYGEVVPTLVTPPRARKWSQRRWCRHGMTANPDMLEHPKGRLRPLRIWRRGAAARYDGPAG